MSYTFILIYLFVTVQQRKNWMESIWIDPSQSQAEVITASEIHLSLEWWNSHCLLWGSVHQWVIMRELLPAWTGVFCGMVRRIHNAPLAARRILSSGLVLERCFRAVTEERNYRDNSLVPTGIKILAWVHNGSGNGFQRSLCGCAQPMRDDVTL